MAKHSLYGASMMVLLATGAVNGAPLNEELSRDAVEVICGDKSGVFEARVEFDNGEILEGEVRCSEASGDVAVLNDGPEGDGEVDTEEGEPEDEPEDEPDGEGEGEGEGEGGID